ncbi:hypothetical protein JYU34_013008 [Plutella xylostella]|uniref:Protein shuttle craft n=1 Tax=Plutella xylostella TaxID=51655 RepID=A0ABQ7QE03_PLUXY|nr:hypothetical protein JYU34_013008 [Plutella xylostella]
MSWNSGYNYNNQYHEPNVWNGDPNAQFVNQNPNYYANNPGNQYVSFDQFLSQMQTNGTSQSASNNFNSVQYQNYTGSEGNSFAGASMVQATPQLESYNFHVNASSGAEMYQAVAQMQYPGVANGYEGEVAFKSTLTPTATEFVPKSVAVLPPIENDKTFELSTHLNGVNNKTNRNSSEKNWRDRPSGSEQSQGKHKTNNRNQDNDSSLIKKYDSAESGQYPPEPSIANKKNNSRKESSPSHETNHKNNESNARDTDSTYSRKEDYNSKHQHGKNRDYNSKSQDTGHRNRDSNSRNQDNYRNQDNGSRSDYRNQESGSRYENRNQEDGSRHDNRHQKGGSRHKDRNQEGGSKYDGKNQESGSRYDSRNQEGGSRYDNRNQDNGSRYEGRNQEGGSRYDNRNQEGGSRYKGRNQEGGSRYDNRNQEGGSRYEGRNQDGGSRYDNRNQEGGSRYDSRNQEGGSRYDYRNQDDGSRYDNRNQESGSRYDNRNNSECNNQKGKSKDSFVGGTFYNSSVSSDRKSQDPRNSKGSEGPLSNNRNWAGSQRLRSERNVMDDEQYASNYMPYREERASKGQERGIKVQGASSPMRNKSKTSNTHNDHAGASDLTQRERLSEQLDKGTLECLVCCERVKQTDSVWSCGNCYHVLHLRCIRKWAMSSVIEGKWRCPACQNTSSTVPTEYRCMCGATRNPEHVRGGAAHTCGGACRRGRACVHPCTLPCHPGPCPPCQATVSKQCGCGAETRSVLCSSKLSQLCAGRCRRKLNCGKHECGKECHEGPCDECQETVTQVCYCPAAKPQTVPCTSTTATRVHWSCGSACARVLACGAHVCRAACHAPPCAPCRLAPDQVLTCPCGNKRIEPGARKSCTDPIPLCGNICAKPLPCGPAGDKHFCKVECHDGECPGCPDATVLQCRCGHSSREVPCADLPAMIDNVFCQKKCNKKLSCGRHRCRLLCCALESHRCQLPCGRSLTCQQHRCEQTCHTGHCAPCPRLGFTELRCECGAQVLLPPVACGTPPPACTAPCRRARPCGHPPHHSCHAGDCPPCVVFTTKPCYGAHEERKTIPCSQDEFSCGLPCGKPLPCGKHTCIKTCHQGPCDTTKCTQPCAEPRSCGHPCGAPCHPPAVPPAPPARCPAPTPCRRAVTVTCPCGRRSAQSTCHENTALHNKMVSALAAAKMQEGGTVDLAEVSRPGASLKCLECDDGCRVEQRTRQMALALQIRNPDVSAKLAPRYGEHARAWAQRDPAFAQQVHQALTDLVQKAKKSKQKTRSHSFPSMNWQKRQFVHELCEHFGCESVAYDAEPNRNVVATADREKSWLPAMSVLEVLSREAGKRRVPGPVLRAPANTAGTAAAAVAGGAASKPSSSGWATLTSTNAWAARSQPKPAPAAAEPKIDYFDNPPE